MSFQQLEDDNINEFQQSAGHKSIKNNISGTLNIFRFVGNIFDLYFTRVKDTLLEMSKHPEEDALEQPTQQPEKDK